VGGLGVAVVVLVRSPFSDLSSSKRRPALVLAASCGLGNCSPQVNRLSSVALEFSQLRHTGPSSRTSSAFFGAEPSEDAVRQCAEADSASRRPRW